MRLLVIAAICIPCIIVALVVNATLVRDNVDFDKDSCPDPKADMTIAFFSYLVALFSTGFIVFAFSDSICLSFGLYDKAPTPDNVTFNKDDDRLFLGGNQHIIHDQSSM